MKKALVFLVLLFFVACNGDNGGGNDNGSDNGSDNSSDNGSDNGTDNGTDNGSDNGTSMYYIRNGPVMPAVLSFSGINNPVIDMTTKDRYRKNDVVNISVYANDTLISTSSTINQGYLSLNITSVASELLTPLSNLFDARCSVPNVNMAVLFLETKDDELDIIRVGVIGVEDNMDITYTYAYADNSANVICQYTDEDGDLIDVFLSINAGWNELKMSEYDTSSVITSDDYWIINYSLDYNQ